MNSKKSKDSQESRSSRISRETRSTKPKKDREKEEKMKVAELIAEAELLQQKQIIQNEAEKLKIKERLAKAQASIQAYSKIELENGNEIEQIQPKLLKENWMRSIRMDDPSRVAKTDIEQGRGSVITKEQNARYTNTWNLQNKMDRVNLPNKTAKEELVHERDQKNITEMTCELLRQQAAPELEIDIFDGNPMDFNYVMAVFKEVVEKKVTDPRGRLIHLIKFTRREAKEIAKNCIQLPSEVGFKATKRLLAERFGNPQYNYSIIS